MAFVRDWEGANLDEDELDLLGLADEALDEDGERTANQRAKMADPEQCWQKALQLLSRQDYSSHRLRRKLAERFSIESVQFALDKAAEYGYINDVAYAERFIRSRKIGRSRQEVRSALRERGLRISDEELDRHYAGEEEVEAARIWLRKRSREKERCGDSKEKMHKLRQKLYQGLMRKGYSYQSIDIALTDFMRDEDDWE